MSQQNPRAFFLSLEAAEIGLQADRKAFLDKQCAADAALRAEVEALIAGNAATADIRPALAPTNKKTSLPQAKAIETALEQPGAKIGPYKLVHQIGEGGFGLVFVAQQERPIRRRVALKIIKPGMDTREIIARFEQERQALALMDHPHIAKVLDAGATPTGRPYFVMELVGGIPITEYCDQQRLSIRERLELFTPVCQAIQHAHQKAIIHRDIKPSNVLVAVHEGRPVVKVIDFGVAKALHQQLSEHTVHTQIAQMIGTPLYMSPEQADLNSSDIDTRCDVYALGALLYVLLTGATIFDKKRLIAAGVDELRRIIREEEPAPPSKRLAESRERLAFLAAQRKTDPARLARLIQGDLDWIVMKCLEKDRTRRYESASSLARDIERHLADEPVDAGPPSAAYRLRKFARRNKRAMMSVGALVLMLLVLSGGAMLYATQQHRLAAQRTKLAQDQKRLTTDKELARQKTAAELFDSLIRQSEAVRLARQPGYRPVVFENLKGAAALDFPGKNLDPIRNQVLACLGDPLGLPPDLAPTGGLPVVPELSATFRALMAGKSGHVNQSPDGKWLVVYPLSYQDTVSGPVSLYRSDGSLASSATSPLGKVLHAKFTSDSGLIALGCEGGLLIWSTPDLHPQLTIPGAPVHAIAVHPAARQIAVAWGSRGNRIELYSLVTNRLVASYARVAPELFFLYGADGQQLLWANKHGELTCGWFINWAPEKQILQGHEAAVTRVVFSPDGLTLASTSIDKRLRIWDSESGAVRAICQHDEKVTDAAFSPDGQFISTLDGHGNIRVWDALTGALRATAGNDDTTWRVQFDVKGERLVAAGSHGIRWWGIRRADSEIKLDSGGLVVSPFIAGEFALSPDGSQVAILTPGGKGGFGAVFEASLYLCDLKDGAKPVRLDAKPDFCQHSLRFDATGTLLRFGTPERAIGTWSINESGQLKNSRDTFAANFLAITADDRWAARLGRSNRDVVVYDLLKDEEVVALPAEASDIETLDISRSGRRLAVGRTDGEVAIWHLDEVQLRLAEFQLPMEATWTGSAPPKRTTAPPSADEQALVYFHIRNYEKAIPLLEGGFKRRQGELGDDHLETLEWGQRLAEAYVGVHRSAAAVPILEACLAGRQAKLGLDHPDTNRSRQRLINACFNSNQGNKAVPHCQYDLDRDRSKFGERHPNMLMSLLWLSSAYRRTNQPEKSLPLAREAVNGRLALYGDDSDLTALARDHLANVNNDLGNHNEAAYLYRKAWIVFQRSQTGDPGVLRAQEDLAGSLLAAGDFEQAETHLLGCYEELLLTKGIAPNSPRVQLAIDRLAELYQQWGRPDDAEVWLRKRLEVKRGAAKDDPITAEAAVNLGKHLMEHGRPNEGEPFLREGLDIQEKLEGNDWHTFHSRSLLGGVLLKQQKFAAAEPLLVLGYEGMHDRADIIPADRKHELGLALERLAQLYKDWGKPEPADKWRQLLEEHQKSVAARIEVAERQAVVHSNASEFDKAIPLLEQVLQSRLDLLGDTHSQTLQARGELSGAYRLAGEFDRAATQLRKTWRGREQTLGPLHRYTIDPENHLGLCLMGLGHYEDAARHLLSSYHDSQKVNDFPQQWVAVYRNRLAELHSRWIGPWSTEPLLRKRLELTQVVMGDEAAETAQLLLYLGDHLLMNGKSEEAEASFRASLAIGERQIPDGWTTFNAKSMTGVALLNQKKYANAEPLLLAGYEGLKQREDKIPVDRRWHIAKAAERVVQLYDDWGKPKEAAMWRKELQELTESQKRDTELAMALAKYEESVALRDARKYEEGELTARESLAIYERLAPEGATTFEVRSFLGLLLVFQKRYSEAEPLLLSAYEALNKHKSPSARDRLYLEWSVGRLVILYDDWAKPAEAAKWRKELEELKKLTGSPKTESAGAIP